ncbi:MAG: hypothetical protein PGN37_20415 [Mycobacterium kyogaense]|uniref:hypothetical protein n=1 Tax=Mycobacterium kyogaense TaxID=2212479 RepID=UPI002FFB986D
MTIDRAEIVTDIEVLPPARPAASEAIGQLMAHAESMTAAKQLADALCDSELVPATYRGKPGNGAAAILYGAELGLNPIQSLQQIFVVHGAPAIYARTAVALLKRHGIVIETVSSTNDAVTVRGSDPRTGQVEESTWDIARADLAGYTSNKKYKTDPQAMLYAKAAMEVCRKIAPDVLLGIPYAREELELEQQPTRVRSERGGVGVSSLRERAAKQQAKAVEAPPAASVDAAQSPPEPASAPQESKPQGLSKSARQKWENAMFALLAEGDCTEKDDQRMVITALAGRPFSDMPEHRNGVDDDELRKVVNTLSDWKKDGRLADEITQVFTAYVQYQSAEQDAAMDDARDAAESAPADG